MNISSSFLTNLIYKKDAGSPDYTSNQGNLIKISIGRRIGEVKYLLQ